MFTSMWKHRTNAGIMGIDVYKRQVRETLEAAGYVFESAEQDMIPQNTVDLDEKQVSQVERLLEVLEDNDDVQNVYHNANLGE